jgi:branched-chain amino acid transport system substrate-binding protein
VASRISEVVIGAAYPLSGPSSPAGLDAKAALELAVDTINTAGPLAGSKLLLSDGKGLPNLGGAKARAIITDHQGDPAKGQGEAERLVTQEKVAALFGMYQSAVTLTASQVAERLGVPYFTAESSSPTLSAQGFKCWPWKRSNSVAWPSGGTCSAPP